MTMQQLTVYLAKHNIPKSMINEIRMVFMDDAIKNGNNIQADRIYTSVALMLHRAFGFGAKRIFKGLKCFDEINGSAAEDTTWAELMQELDDETGIIIRSGEDKDRLAFEYKRRVVIKKEEPDDGKSEQGL